MIDDNASTQKTQSVVFLGLCERAHHTQEGNTDIFKWNVIGLKTTILSYIYPLKIANLSVGFAFSAALAGENAKFSIVNDAGKEIGTLNLTATSASSEEEDLIQKTAVPLPSAPEYGWRTVFLPLGSTDLVIEEPGIYYIEQVSTAGNIRVGTIQFEVAHPEPLSPERVAAIKSDPSAAKAVRLELGCKHCDTKYRVYAALEVNEEADQDGWIWYKHVDDMFECGCGRTNMTLEYIRRNLHGLLGSKWTGRPEADFMPLYEGSSLRVIRDSFAKLVSKSVGEESLQQFLQSNPILLHQFPAEKILPKPAILTSHIADFGIVTGQKELVLVEIEKSTTRLMKKGGDIAAPLNHAFDQVRNWLHEIDEHRIAVLDSLGIDRNDVSTVRGVVIAGRDVGYDARDLRRLKGKDFGRVSFLTYDDLLFSIDSLIRSVESV